MENSEKIDVKSSPIVECNDVGAESMDDKQKGHIEDILYLETITFTEAEEREVVKKIDRFLLPFMCAIFFSQYLDKQSLTYASVFDLKTDLKMAGHDYSWCTTMFYLGQLGANFVFMYLMTKIPRAPMTGACVVIWSVCCMCLAAPNTKQGFWVGRLFLGLFEAVVSPACVLITSNWYRKREQPLRTACWISMNALAQIVGSFLMYGIGKTNKSSLADWRLMFLICGIISLVAGVAFYACVPLSAKTAWFLNKREKEIAIKRLFDDSDRVEGTTFNREQLKECLNFDWLFLTSFAFGFLICVPSGTLVFQSLILAGFGYDKFQNMEYGSPSGAVQLMFVWIGVLLVKIFPKERALISILLVCVPLVGNIMLLCLSSSSGWWVIVASWLGSVATCTMTILLSLISSNVRGDTKKSLCSNAFFVGYCVAIIIYPQWWTGTYRGGLIVNVIMWILLDILLIFYRFKVVFENKKRRELIEKNGAEETHVNQDVTDKQDIFHKYVH
ncbi:LAFE_0H00364g1_1 [Lachancea fermentati]|uniref:LAFE_0H00364g1_1 n=1 Tax=Lachancea fermentati TaxID=4955 RepID=A0A1G4MJC4_LACFM|nr:LAFE_0H00364g1_1 [Lachancea fermentati]